MNIIKTWLMMILAGGLLCFSTLYFIGCDQQDRPVPMEKREQPAKELVERNTVTLNGEGEVQIITLKDRYLKLKAENAKLKDSINILKPSKLDSMFYDEYLNYVALFFGKGDNPEGVKLQFFHQRDGETVFNSNPGYKAPDTGDVYTIKFHREFVPSAIKLQPINMIASAYDSMDTGPQKAFDGIGYRGNNNALERWTVKPMPAWIQADLGSLRKIDSIRISFYNFEAGRMYNFEILTSNDGMNWSNRGEYNSLPIEWNSWKVFFDCRFIRFNLLASVPIENNPSQWANIWEIEIYGKEQQ